MPVCYTSFNMLKARYTPYTLIFSVIFSVSFSLIYLKQKIAFSLHHFAEFVGFEFLDFTACIFKNKYKFDNTLHD